DGLGVSAIGSRLERETIKSQRHMRVVVVRGCVVRPAYEADGEGRRNAEHIPTRERRIAVQILQTEFSVRRITPLQLRARVIRPQASLLQGIAYVALCVLLIHFHGGESLRVQPCHRIVELLYVFSRVGEPGGQPAIYLSAHLVGRNIDRREAQPGRNSRQRRNSMIGGERNPYVRQANLVSQKLEEPGQLPIGGQNHGLHLRRIGTDLVAKNIVGRQTDDQQ